MIMKSETKELHFDYYPAYGTIPDLGHLNGYIDWWKVILARDSRPTRKSITFRDLRGMHSRVVLCHVLEDRSDMVAHIVGEDVKALFRSYMSDDQPAFERGTHLRELVSVKKSAQDAHMRRIADDLNIAITSGKLALITGRTVDISALDFPLVPIDEESPYVLTIYDFELKFQDRNVPHHGLVAC